MKTRRMLPTDIPECLKISDIYPVVSARGIEDEMTAFLADLMVHDQLWGSVIEDSGSSAPICFGSCIFIAPKLAAGLRKGEHPFLLSDLCQYPILRSHILSYEEVEKQSKQYHLNFYGALFSFPRTKNPMQFGKAMNHLQRSLVNTISGFGLDQYLKHSYGMDFMYRELTNVAMRFAFGAKLDMKYETSSDPEVKRHHPYLFASTREEAVTKPGKPVFEVMCPGDAILKLPRAVRMLLRLEIEGYSHEAVAQALLRGHHDSNWSTALIAVRRNTQVADFLGMNEEDAVLRDCIREYVKQNPQELGVLPLLTPEEKQCWQLYHNLDNVAAANRKPNGDARKVA